MRYAKSLVKVFFCFLLIAVTISPASAADEKLRLLVVTGGHDYSTSFYDLFMGNEKWTWDHQYPAANAYRRDLRNKYDVLVIYDAAWDDIGEKPIQNLRNFLESGKGVVILHHSLLDRGYGEWWYKDVAGGLYLREPMMGMTEKSTFSHGEKQTVTVVQDHPITRGLDKLTIVDETYKGMWISPKVQVLMETDNPKGDKPVVWVSPYEKSKVVLIQLGHDEEAYHHPGFRQLLEQSILWTAGKLK